MLSYTYEVKGANLQTPYFFDHIHHELRESKYLGLSVNVSKYSHDGLHLAVSHADMKVIERFIDWIKSATKGSSKVQSIRKL